MQLTGVFQWAVRQSTVRVCTMDSAVLGLASPVVGDVNSTVRAIDSSLHSIMPFDATPARLK
jgi:hypothetical protein